MSLRLTVLLLAAVGVYSKTQSGNSQAAIDHVDKGESLASPLLTAPAELVPVSAENIRFSRLLKDSANVLQFSSISNDAPPIWGIARDEKKEQKGQVKTVKISKKNNSSGTNFGRRALDYDEQVQAFEEPTSETKIVANPYPGNEYVFVRPGKLVETPADSDVAASVTSINNKPPRVPLALLRQKKGKRVNISPLFTEVPQLHQDSPEAKEFVWVDQPVEYHHRLVGVNRQGRKHDDEDEATTNPAFQDEDLIEATTLAENVPVETTTARHNNKSKLIVNVVTSAPRVSVESSVGERKTKKSSRDRTKATTTTTSTTTSASTTTTSEATTEASSTTFTYSSTSPVPTTTAPLVLSSSSSKSVTDDDKENLVVDAFHRSGSSFHGFEDSHTRLQTAESSQPARVNVRPAQNGKEYEYEYIYYYYDDDEGENSEKQGDAKVKAVDQTKDVKSTSQTPSTSSSTASTQAASSDAASSTTVTITSSSTTSTTTLAPELTSDADFEYEDDAVIEEEIKAQSKAPELQKSTPTVSRTTDEPVHKGVSSAEKLSNSNPINQLDRTRGPKILPGKFDETIADYKLETEASQEEEVVQTQALSKGQPRQHQHSVSFDEDEQSADSSSPATHSSSREPSTSAPSSTSGFDVDHMPTLAKTHKDSVNVPIVLKQSSLLKAVPVSQLQPHQVNLAEEQPSTAPYTTPTTTTTTAAASEVISSARPSSPRLRGHRLRGSVTPRPTSTSTGNASEQPTEEKPVRRPHLRDSSRRVPSRRPVQEVTDNVQEQQPAASPIIEAHARPVPIRPRFPPRTHAATTASPTSEVTVSDAPVTVSAAELNSLDDKKTKDAHVRAKSANDLFAFARLQQAISSRAPSRVQPKLVAGFVNSAEVTTDAVSSSEVTTVSSFGGQSGESLISSSVEPTSTTTTSTTEAVHVDKFGRQRGGPRFGGRTRKPLGGAGATSTTTTETPSTTRSRFSGRRRTSTTESPEGGAQQTSVSANNSETPKPRIPSRNRFASRNRLSTTEASATAEEQKPAEAAKPAVTQPRRRPGAFGGRRRPNQIQAQTETPAPQEEKEKETAPTTVDASSTAAATSTAAPSTVVSPGRNRFNFAAGGGRPRPGSHGTGNNPVRIRGAGRLRGPTTTTTTTEAAAVEQNAEEADQQKHADAEQSQSIQSENLEQPIHTPPTPESTLPQRGGVLGRLKNRPKLVVTTTPAPEASGGERKHSRLNGILNRRKNLGQLSSAVHVKEEVRESTSEAAEEANNHAKEQDDDHKGVVVQISSSVTESEEVNEAHASEVIEPPSTTPGSILNRLKSQRKPGSLFRKKPDPHGE